LSHYCNLPQEEHWNAVQVLLFFSLGDARLPDDVYAPCSQCDHVGWRWHLGATMLCRACRAHRLRAARALERLARQHFQDESNETSSKATGEVH
jgi:hypothetical protein